MSLQNPANEIPKSTLVSAESYMLTEVWNRQYQEFCNTCRDENLNFEGKSLEQIAVLRIRQAELFWQSPIYQNVIERYPVEISTFKIANVTVEEIEPTEGISEENKNKVLINLHGGNFTTGARTFSRIESIPIASLGRIKVLSIDFRQGPEHRFPAAVDDVLAVYKILLNDFQSQQIGIYGGSSGAVLCAQLMARLSRDRLPMPAGIGMIAAAACYFYEGDSGWIAHLRMGAHKEEKPSDNPYFSGVLASDALAFPGNDNTILSQFPPSLLISSSREYTGSAGVHTHSQLTQLGVLANLHIWDGLEHLFIYNTALPASREAFTVIVDFFQRRLSS